MSCHTEEAYFYNEKRVEIRPCLNFSDKILGAVFSFPYLIVMEKKGINVIPLYRSKEQTMKLELGKVDLTQLAACFTNISHHSPSITGFNNSFLWKICYSSPSK